MEMGVALLLFALGAILAFAMRVSPPVINLHVVGYVLMAISAVGFYLSRRGPGWARRIIVIPRRRRTGPVQVDHVTYPPYLKVNPNAIPGDGVIVEPDPAADRVVVENGVEDV